MKLARWTKEEVDFIYSNYEKMSRRELASALGRSYGSVKTKIDKELKLRKSKEAIRAMNRRPNAGQFNKGECRNRLPIGSITERLDSNGNTYRWIKIKDDRNVHAIENWRHLHVHLWIEHHGEVPEDKIVVFKDGDQNHCVIENLELITRAEAVKRTRTSDGFVVKCLTALPGGCGKYDRGLAEVIKEDHPELIELKRHQLTLNRKIKENEK